MNLDKYLETINSIHFLIESLTIRDVEKNIEDTKRKMDILNSKIQSRINRQELSIPYSKIRIEFLKKLNLSVRSGTEKASIELTGRQDFMVVGYSENNYIIVQQRDWDSTIGLIIYTSNFEKRVNKKSEVQLFYSQYGSVGSGIKTRSSKKEDIIYRIISLS